MKYFVEFVMNAIIENKNELKNRQNQILTFIDRKFSFHHESYRKNRIERINQ